MTTLLAILFAVAAAAVDGPAAYQRGSELLAKGQTREAITAYQQALAAGYLPGLAYPPARLRDLMERLAAVVQDNRLKPAADIHSGIRSSLKAFTAGHPANDDSTMIVLKF